MTKQEALKMVRDAQSHIETFGRCHAKAEKAASNDLYHAESRLEFEIMFEGKA